MSKILNQYLSTQRKDEIKELSSLVIQEYSETKIIDIDTCGKRRCFIGVEQNEKSLEECIK